METPFLDLINSEHFDRFGNLDDRLERPDWVASFLTGWGLDRVLGSEEVPVVELRELRALMRRLVEELDATGEPDEADVARLNDVIRASPVVHRLERHDAEWHLMPEPVERGPQALLATVARSAASFLSDAELERIKICRNDRCRWVFYDESKNRSRTWCDTSCGNLHKVRRYRERQKQQRSAST